MIAPLRAGRVLLACVLIGLTPCSAPADEAPATKPARAPEERLPAPWAERLARHAAWLAELGNPVLLDLMGLTFLQPAQRQDPRRLVLRGEDLREATLAGATLRAADLGASNLAGAQLMAADARHVRLAGANLADAQLNRARLYRADLEDATLRGATLIDADLREARMRDADLRGANLIGADLEGASLPGADLTEANLNDAVLQATDLTLARLSGADLHQTRLTDAHLFHADLSGARITRADLSGAQLFGADLTDALIQDSTLSGVNLAGAVLAGTNLFDNDLAGTDLAQLDLAGVIFEPPPERLAALAQRLDELTRARNLGLMTFFNNPEPLESLRRILTRGDYTRERLAITYAIRRGQRQKAATDGTLLQRLGSLVQLVFVEIPIEYGAAPLRPLLIVFVLIGLFGGVYVAVILFPSPYWGELWRITPREPFSRRSRDAVTRERVEGRRPTELLIPFWFSFLSALNIGGRVFNVDDLFINCQREEYYLRATGWARTLSGVQALITLYLLLLMLLIFFEKVTF